MNAGILSGFFGGAAREVNAIASDKMQREADAVQLGRPTLYGLAAAGQSGVSHALGILSAELEVAMALSGAASVQQLRGRAEVDTAR